MCVGSFIFSLLVIAATITVGLYLFPNYKSGRRGQIGLYFTYLGITTVRKSRGDKAKMEDRNVRRGDIYHADLDPVFGSEQGGYRPVLVIQNNIGNKYSPTVIS